MFTFSHIKDIECAMVSNMVGVASPSYVVSMEIWLTVHALLGLYSTA